jgi:hypothetical protein
MMPGLSTRIGIIGFILILIIVLSAALINAQSPTVTTAPTTPVTTTPTATAAATPTPGPTNIPAMRSITVDITETGNATPSTTADVKLSVKINNFDLTTNVPTATPTGATAQGLIKYSFDMAKETPGVSPGAPPVSVPIATTNSAEATPGTSILSTDTSFTFNNVPEGVHTFTIELVKNDGSSLDPKAYINIEVNVIPTSGGGLFGKANQ